MKQRITMNSASLQEKFPEVYREFFSKCPVVVSAPGDFFWAGEYAMYYGGLTIAQHVPLRTYVGIKPNTLNRLRMIDYKNYIPSKEKFETLSLESLNLTHFTEFLNQEKEKLFPGKNIGFDFYALSETPIWCGLNPSGALSVCLATLYYLSMGKISFKDVKRWSSIASADLHHNKECNQIIRLAWKLDSEIHDGFIPVSRVFTPFAWSSLPIFSFAEKIDGDIEKLDSLDTMSFWGGNFNEIIEDKEFTFWPVDVALIYTGEQRSTELVVRSTHVFRKSLDTKAKELRKFFKKYDSSQKILFWKNLSNRDGLWRIYIDTLSTISLEIFSALKCVFDGSSENDLDYFLKLIRKYHSGFRLLNLSTPRTQQIEAYLRDYSWRNGSMTAGVKLIGPGMGGDILFATPTYDLREKMGEIIDELSKKDKSKIVSLDYASWLDGFEEEGVRVDQEINEGLYSDFVSQGSIWLKNLSNNGLYQTELKSIEDFENEKIKTDLLLDTVNEDIYTKGKKLTSKELPSSSMALEILNILIENIGKSVSNTKLPDSSYARDRNEMQSKIVSPLLRVIKKETGKKILLQISGGLTDFRLKLDTNDLKIKVINKIF